MSTGDNRSRPFRKAEEAQARLDAHRAADRRLAISIPQPVARSGWNFASKLSWDPRKEIIATPT